MPSPAITASFAAPGARRALGGFFLSGVLLAFVGAVMPSWGYHLESTFQTVGEYFLASSLGILVSVRLAHVLMRYRGLGTILVTGSAIGCVSLLYLAAVCPPAPAWARMIGLFLVGVSIGLLHAAIFHAITPMYRHDPGATINLCGTLFGLGCLTVALLMAWTYYVYTPPSVLMLLAVIPGLFVIFFVRTRFARPDLRSHRPISEVVSDLKSPAALFFALLLFFQLGNEWALTGWLPLFLVKRLGISPEESLRMLALLWFSLLAGRIVAQSIMPHVAHSRLLMGCAVAAFFGCLILSLTDNRFGATVGVLSIGCAFAPIYPLVVEKIGSRFPDYHPGFFNGIFVFAFGGLMAPCTLGWLADIWDIRVVTILPLFGTMMVLLLLMAIWVEGRIPDHGSASATEPAGPS